jgi:hypothetical protein
MFTGKLTRYTMRHTKVSNCHTYRCSQVYLHATPPDALRSATASHINVRRSTYCLHHHTHQCQLLPYILMFAGQLTRYTTRHTKVSYCPHISMFAGQLTAYTIRHTKVSYCLTYQCLQVNLPTTPPHTPRSATASHINVRRSTYTLHHQTHQGQHLLHISMFAAKLTCFPPDTPRSATALTYRCSQVNLQATPPDISRSATASHIDVHRYTYTLHHQTHQGQLQPHISMFAAQPMSFTTRHTKVSYCLTY